MKSNKNYREGVNIKQARQNDIIEALQEQFTNQKQLDLNNNFSQQNNLKENQILSKDKTNQQQITFLKPTMIKKEFKNPGRSNILNNYLKQEEQKSLKLKISSAQNPDLKENLIQTQTESQLNLFLILDEQTIIFILKFLNLKDLSRFSLLSRKARNIIPSALLNINTQIFKNEINQIGYQKLYGFKPNLHWFILINYSKWKIEAANKYLQYMKENEETLLQFFQQNLKKNIMKKFQMDILFYNVKNMANYKQNKENLLQFIIQNGIRKTFADMELYYFQPLTFQVFEHQIPSTNQDQLSSSIPIQFFSLLYQHLKNQITNSYSIREQKRAILLYQRKDMLQKIINIKEQFQLKYNRPIWHLNRKTNIFDYLNKNIIIRIIPFLTVQETAMLLQTCKTMKFLIQFGLNSLLVKYETIKVEMLQAAKLTQQEASCIADLLEFQIERKIYGKQLQQTCKFYNTTFYQQISQLINFQIYNEYSDDVFSNDIMEYQPKLKSVLALYQDSVLEQQFHTCENKIKGEELIKFVRRYFNVLNLRQDLDISLTKKDAYIDMIFFFDIRINRFNKLLQPHFNISQLFQFGINYYYSFFKRKQIIQEDDFFLE